jgi:hypothetical protein
MLSAPLRILIVAALCVAGLIALVVNEGAARQGGDEITLPMEAVDPRALLSGHYVVIDLTEGLEPGEACPDGEAGAQWLAFAPEGDAYTLAGAAPDRESAQAIAPTIAKGAFTCSAPFETGPDSPMAPGWVRLDLGVNRFHIAQNDAERIERVLREQNADDAARAFAIVSLGRDGRARLKGLLIDGERLDLSWL